MNNLVKFFPFVLMLIWSCSNNMQMIEITDGITINIPEKYNVTESNPSDIPVTWEVIFEDDLLKIFKYQIMLNDSLSMEERKDLFRKNIDSFIYTFIPENVDSTYSNIKDVLKNDLSFNYTQNGNKYRLYAEFIVTDREFIAFCFNTPFPVDRYSKNLSTKLINSIVITE